MDREDINITIAKNITRLLEKKNKNQFDLADYMGVSQPTVSNWCQGVKLPRMDKIDEICKFFNVSRSTLMESDGLDNFDDGNLAVKIPILGTVVAGMPISAYQDILGYEEITPEMAQTGEFYALRVKGDSMSPRICDGDIVIVKVQSDVECGDIAVVIVNGDEATVKKISKSEEGITLIANNPAVYTPRFYTNKQIKELPVVISGKVVELRAQF